MKMFSIASYCIEIVILIVFIVIASFYYMEENESCWWKRNLQFTQCMAEKKTKQFKLQVHSVFHLLQVLTQSDSRAVDTQNCSKSESEMKRKAKTIFIMQHSKKCTYVMIVSHLVYETAATSIMFAGEKRSAWMRNSRFFDVWSGDGGRDRRRLNDDITKCTKIYRESFKNRCGSAAHLFTPFRSFVTIRHNWAFHPKINIIRKHSHQSNQPSAILNIYAWLRRYMMFGRTTLMHDFFSALSLTR